MADLLYPFRDVAWPLAILVAWAAGEAGYALARLPRISVYGLVGFALGAAQLGLLTHGNDRPMLLAHVGFGLILFEVGYRIDLRWLRSNPWIGVAASCEAVLTFAGVLLVCRALGTSGTTALLVGALAMSTSPAGVLRVVHEERSSGQVTERILHHAAISSILAALAFKIIVGVVAVEAPGMSWVAVRLGAVVLVASAALGAALGVAVPALLRVLGRTAPDGTLAFAAAVVFLVTLAHALHLSPLVATLAFGVVVRHRRVVLSRAQRGFGALGDLLSVVLFVFLTTGLEWRHVVAGLGLGLGLVGVRALAKVAGTVAFAGASGLSWTKGLFTGAALMPFSGFVLLLLEQTRELGVDLVEQLPPLAAAALVLDLAGPLLTQRALRWARELPEAEGAGRPGGAPASTRAAPEAAEVAEPQAAEVVHAP